MSRKTPPARFRLRLEDGSEVPVSTVEALARRVSRGDLLPDTPLFDAGPGSWSRAADSNIVQFILDQMKEEGKDVPEEWTSPSAQPGAGGETAVAGGEPGAGDEDLADSATEAADPATETADATTGGGLDFDFTLADFPDEGGEGGEVSTPVAADEPASLEGPPGPAPVVSEPETPSFEMPPMDFTEEEIPVEAPLDPEPSVGDLAGSEAGLLADDTPSADDEWAMPAAEPEADEEEAEEVLEPASAEDEAADAPEALPPRPRPRSGSKVLVGIGALVVVGGGIAAYVIMGGGSGGEEGAGGPPPTATAPAAPAPAPPPPIPSGLEGAVDEALALYRTRIQAVVDSLRGANALQQPPARDWLGGVYLANAGDFPAIREFWVGYQAFVTTLRTRDRSIWQTVVTESRPDGESGSQLERYLGVRYEAASAAKQGRYDELLAVARQAVQFHDFLVSNQESFRYTPALGSAIPQDPVLEMETSTPELRAALTSRLDPILAALDRSRGSVVMPGEGLAVDLFQRFGEI